MGSDERIEPTRESTGVVVERGVAQFIDGLVILAIAVALGVALRIQSQAAALIVTAVLVFTYNTTLEGFLNGQTLGKRLVDIRVVDRSGAPPSPAQAAARNVPGLIPVAGIVLLVAALVAIASTDRRQRVFDTAADTFVVGTNSRRRASSS
ncbi:hypothetical protein GRX03_14070 [Halovenus sp. WSH3]|uniref:RDD domain-containing protein n=1 Tax=Halovenus carboxidivorans TaxID=2692199 RepID=A0A6B0T907_9EURY|nr:RDD family protein [Halovenus carboxidivorans]MXR52726.1 hypothetical protein [Halovenus carboxidivorans]